MTESCWKEEEDEFGIALIPEAVTVILFEPSASRISLSNSLVFFYVHGVEPSCNL